jgi:UPF0271 protein
VARARVSLNIDLGELPGESDELYAIATLVNVACGGHAGDRATMRRACALARASSARIAAHPSYPDREGFGRRTLPIAPSALRASVAEQCAALREIAREVGAEVCAVKPHGALYHDASARDELALAVVLGAYDALGSKDELAVMGPPTSRLREATARNRALRYLAEGFADRRYLEPHLENWRLAPRTDEDALLVDPAKAAEQARRLLRTSTFDTICVHGDTPGAVSIARAVRAALVEEGVLA